MRYVSTIVIVAAVAAPAAAGPAFAYVVEDAQPFPGPVVRVSSEVPRYDRALRRAMAAVNRLQVGVRLSLTRNPARAQIVTSGLLPSSCRPGRELGRTTSRSGAGALARIRIARGCTTDQARMVIAHELGHALGLGHEDRRCAVMNTVLITGFRPRQCPVSVLARRGPFRADDIRGLRRIWRNQAPVAALGFPYFTPTYEGRAARFPGGWTDPDGNLASVTIDWADGTRPDVVPPIVPAAACHVFAAAGTVLVRVTATDTYGARSTVTQLVEVRPAQDDPFGPAPCPL